MGVCTRFFKQDIRTSSDFLFVTHIQWVLNLRPYPLPFLIGGRAAVWARAQINEIKKFKSRKNKKYFKWDAIVLISGQVSRRVQIGSTKWFSWANQFIYFNIDMIGFDLWHSFHDDTLIIKPSYWLVFGVGRIQTQVPYLPKSLSIDLIRTHNWANSEDTYKKIQEFHIYIYIYNYIIIVMNLKTK